LHPGPGEESSERDDRLPQGRAPRAERPMGGRDPILQPRDRAQMESRRTVAREGENSVGSRSSPRGPGVLRQSPHLRAGHRGGVGGESARTFAPRGPGGGGECAEASGGPRCAASIGPRGEGTIERPRGSSDRARVRASVGVPSCGVGSPARRRTRDGARRDRRARGRPRFPFSRESLRGDGRGTAIEAGPEPRRAGRMTVLPPETARRFLPSVDRLENAMRAARRSLDRGDLEGALREDDVAIQLKPEYDAAWLLRGHIFRKDGNVPGAIEAFAQALKINGESQEGWLGLASSLHAVGRYPEEIEAYDRLLQIQPRSLEAWIDKGA